MTLGSTKFSSSRLEASTTTSMIAASPESAVAEGDDHGQPATEEGADVGDVAADEVDHHDGEHEREAEQEGGEADDHRDDGGHDGAALPVVAQDPAGVTDEAVDVAAQRRVERADDGASEAVAVLEQVVHDQRAEDDAADQPDDAADALDRPW